MLWVDTQGCRFPNPTIPLSFYPSFGLMKLKYSSIMRYRISNGKTSVALLVPDNQFKVKALMALVKQI
jgi:hypothetical protein